MKPDPKVSEQPDSVQLGPEGSESATNRKPGGSSFSGQPQTSASGSAPSSPTLIAYYTQAKPNPSRFLKALRAEPSIRNFDSQDREAVLRDIDRLDPTFQKTLALAVKVFEAGPSSTVRWCAEWPSTALLHELQGKQSLSIDQGARAEEILVGISTGLRPGTRGKNTAKRALNQMAIAVLWLADSRGLDVLQAMHVLRDFVGPARKGMDSNQRDRLAIQNLLKGFTGLRALQGLVLFAQTFISRAETAADETIRARAMLSESREDIAKLQARLEQSDSELIQLRRELESEKRRYAELESQARGEQIALRHETQQLQARFAGFLEKTIGVPLATALDAVKLEPPRIAVVQERLELATEAVQSEIHKLRKG